MKTDYQFSVQMLEKAKSLGYAPDDLPLLLLMPFVRVAWAEGFVQAGEQRAILRLAENLGVKAGHPDYKKLHGWLEERPDEESFDVATTDLRRLLDELPPKQAARLRSMLQFGCVEVAHAAGDIGLLRGGSNVRREEREQLQHIGERLGLVHGSGV